MTRTGTGGGSRHPANLDDGAIFKLEPDGKIPGKFGKGGKLAREFGTVNQMDYRGRNELYVAEVLTGVCRSCL